jgi:hypothetical protein
MRKCWARNYRASFKFFVHFDENQSSFRIKHCNIFFGVNERVEQGLPYRMRVWRTFHGFPFNL